MNLLSADEIIGGAVHCTKIKPQIYFLIDKKEIVYIGSSIQFGGRLIQHLRSEKVFTHYFLLDCGIDEMEILEYRYINKFNPKYNVRMLPYDYAPIEKITPPSGLSRKKFIKFVNDLNLPKDEFNCVRKSAVRIAWIEKNGGWLYRQRFLPITKDSPYYDEFINTGRVKSLDSLSAKLHAQEMEECYGQYR